MWWPLLSLHCLAVALVCGMSVVPTRSVLTGLETLWQTSPTFTAFHWQLYTSVWFILYWAVLTLCFSFVPLNVTQKMKRKGYFFPQEVCSRHYTFTFSVAFVTSGILFSLVPPCILNYSKAAIHSKHFVTKFWEAGGEVAIVSVAFSIVVKVKNSYYKIQSYRICSKAKCITTVR